MTELRTCGKWLTGQNFVLRMANQPGKHTTVPGFQGIPSHPPSFQGLPSAQDPPPSTHPPPNSPTGRALALFFLLPSKAVKNSAGEPNSSLIHFLRITRPGWIYFFTAASDFFSSSFFFVFFFSIFLDHFLVFLVALVLFCRLWLRSCCVFYKFLVFLVIFFF